MLLAGCGSGAGIIPDYPPAPNNLYTTLRSVEVHPQYMTEFGPDIPVFQAVLGASPMWNTYADNRIGFNFTYAGSF